MRQQTAEVTFLRNVPITTFEYQPVLAYHRLFPPPPAHRQYTHPPPVIREIFTKVERYFSYTPQRREAPGNEDEPVIIAEARTGTTRPGVHHAILQF